MEVIDIEKLVDYKILPFDVFDKDGEALLYAGEVLTAGKILQLRAAGTIYRIPSKKSKENFDNKKTDTKESYESPKEEFKNSLPVEENIVEKVSLLSSSTYMSPLDDIDENRYIGPVNVSSTIDTKTQIKLKSFYYSVQKNIRELSPDAAVKNILVVRDKILNDLTKTINKTSLFSELKLVGEYSKCHDLNVAILANAFAIKYGLKAKDTQDLVLSALLHDIGKKYLPQELVNKPVLTLSEKKELEKHTIVGYNVIRNQMHLSQRVALPALQHHEHINGTGYPNKLSEENVDFFSQIVGICSYFDNLTSNRTEYKVKNVREALRHVMEKWKEIYSSDVLYTFIYMFSYNDIKNFEDMVM